jgi:toxin HigB-1
VDSTCLAVQVCIDHVKLGQRSIYSGGCARHDDLFHGRVAGAFADTVDGAFDLASRKVREGEQPNRCSAWIFDAVIDLLLASNVEGAPGPEPAQERGAAQAQGRPRGPIAHDGERPWRICFAFRKGDAYDVEIAYYHAG